MPRSEKSKRLKQNMIDGLSKSIKLMQTLKCEENKLNLTSDSPYICSFLSHIDNLFLYGLKHTSRGYWKYVRQFTDKVTTSEIMASIHLKTDIARGRSWLLISLNAGLMESYMNTIIANPAMAVKFYKKDSIINDFNMLVILNTLICGLDFVPFKLTTDAKYLDKSCFPQNEISLHNVEVEAYPTTPTSISSRRSQTRVLQTADEGNRETLHVMSSGQTRPPRRRKRRTGDLGDPTDLRGPCAPPGGAANSPISRLDETRVVPRPRIPSSSSSSSSSESISISCSSLSLMSSQSFGSSSFSRSPSILTDYSPESSLAFPAHYDSDHDIHHHPHHGASSAHHHRRRRSSSCRRSTQDSGLGTEDTTTTSTKATRTGLENSGVQPTMTSNLDQATPTNCTLQITPTNLILHTTPTYAIEFAASRTDSNLAALLPLHRQQSTESSFEAENTSTSGVLDLSASPCRSTSSKKSGAGGVEANPHSDLATTSCQEEQRRAIVDDARNVIAEAIRVVGGTRSLLRRISSTKDNLNTLETSTQPQGRRAGKQVPLEPRSGPQDRRGSSRKGKRGRRDRRPPLSTARRGNGSEASEERGGAGDQLTSESTALESSADVTSDSNVHDSIYDFGEDNLLNLSSSYTLYTEASRHVGAKGDAPQEGEKVVENGVKVVENGSMTNGGVGKSSRENRKEKEPNLHPGEIEFDDNMILQISLDILKYDTEQPIKMFSSYLGHNIGEKSRVFFLITDCAVYTCKSINRHRCKYDVLQSLEFNEIDYISLSINQQIMTIFTKIKSRIITLTTGNSGLTSFIVSSILSSAERLNLTISVLEDSTFERISVTKSISSEFSVAKTRVDLTNVTLINWMNSQVVDYNIYDTIQGHLKIKQPGNLLFSETWTKAYFNLRGTELQQFTDLNMTTLIRNIELGNGEMMKCGKSSTSLTSPTSRGQRNNHQRSVQFHFRLTLKSGEIVELKTSSAKIQDNWLVHLNDIINPTNRKKTFSTISCCVATATISQDKDKEGRGKDTKDKHDGKDLLKPALTIYQERSTFVRILDQTSLEKLNAIFAEDNICVLMFDESSYFWLFYFNYNEENNIFTSNVSKLYKSYFKEKMDIKIFEDEKLLNKCRASMPQLILTDQPVSS